MSKLVVLSLFGGLGYLSIQYWGGWMIFIPALQQLSVALLSLLLCIVGHKVLGEEIRLAPLLIAPALSFFTLLIIYEGELGLLFDVSFLNFLAFVLTVIIYRKVWLCILKIE